MKDRITNLLRENKAMPIEVILKKLNMDNKNEIKAMLESMVSTGEIVYSVKKKKYMLFEDSGLYKGRICVNKNHDYYLKDGDRKILIPSDYLKDACVNDYVLVNYLDDYDCGKVIKVISKYKNEYVGEVVLRAGDKYISNDDFGIMGIINDNNDLIQGHKVLFKNIKGDAEVVKILGHKDDPMIDVISVLADYGFSNDFSDATMEELKHIPDSLSLNDIKVELGKGRVDYRDKTIFTIDGSDTKDIDDAVSIEVKDNGDMVLGVYIADVSHYVKDGSGIDNDAKLRRTSVYPANSVSPMLPHQLSNGICSINPDVDRLALCFITTFDKNGKVIGFDINEGIVRSRIKMNYDDVNMLLEDEIIKDEYRPFAKDLYQMQKLSLILSERFLNSGKLEFSTTEAKLILDDNGNVIDIKKRHQKTAEKMIENFMLVSNNNAMEWVKYLELPGVYRIHDEADNNKLSNAVNFINKKYHISDNLKKDFSRKDLQNMLKVLETKEDKEMLNRLLIRSQARAKYSLNNIGHSALAFDDYGQFTSPIRRYPDLMNHRVVKGLLNHGYDYVWDRYGDLSSEVESCNMKEIDSDNCCRDVYKMKVAEYLQDKIGSEYKGIVSGICRYGYWVDIDNKFEGFIRVDSLPKDHYEYEEDNYALVGKRDSFCIGDKVLVILRHADKKTMEIDFDYVSKELDKNEKKGKTKIKTREHIHSN